MTSSILGCSRSLAFLFLSFISRQNHVFLLVTFREAVFCSSLQHSAGGDRATSKRFVTKYTAADLSVKESNGRPESTRRALLLLQLPALLLPVTASTSSSAASRSEEPFLESPSCYESLTVPLQYVPFLSAYVVYYSVGGERFGAIVDTGSPFLVVPGYCNRQKYGCYIPDKSRPSGLTPTLERFDNSQGQVEWRMASFSFANATGSLMGTGEMVFGVLSDSLMRGPGGLFLGLIRDTDKWIRPSFLGQTSVKALEIDLKESSDPKTLTLWSKLLNQNEDYIPLVRDLNRKYGDPVNHYTARVSAFEVNGCEVLDAKNRRPIYVIFDTGVTGMVVSSELLDQRYRKARQNKEKSLWGNVKVSISSHLGDTVSVTARKPVTTPLGEKPWPKFRNAHLIVVGLAFLDGRKIGIDIDRQRLYLS